MLPGRFAAAARVRLILIACVCCSAPAAGCDFPPGFSSAQTPRSNSAQQELLAGPRIYVESIRRGFIDRNFASCAQAGVITLILDPRDISPTDVYSFEPVDGTLPGEVLPRGNVRPVELESGQTGFAFHWNDLLPGAQSLETIDALIRINRISFAGDRSAPLLLRLESAGGPPASPALSLQNWNAIAMWVAAALVLLVIVSLRMKAFRRPSRRRDDLAAIQARLRVLANEKRADEKKASENKADDG